MRKILFTLTFAIFILSFIVFGFFSTMLPFTVLLNLFGAITIPWFALSSLSVFGTPLLAAVLMFVFGFASAKIDMESFENVQGYIRELGN